MSEIDSYIETAVEHAAIALLWQATDDSEDGGSGFPITDGGNEYSEMVVEKVPYLTEAVTAFVTGNYETLTSAGVTAEQCGQDFILTANGHGAGFWDRGLDMPAAGQDVAIAMWDAYDRPHYRAWVASLPLSEQPKSAGDRLTDASDGYSFYAEFRLDTDGEITWLDVENVVLVDENGLAS